MQELKFQLPQESLEAIQATMLESATIAFQQVVKSKVLPKFLNQKQAAQFLNLSENSFKRWVKPLVPAVEINGLFRWDQTDLQQFMESKKIN
jgi:predicted DNA-binding transcriptional regulator AlpA